MTLMTCLLLKTDIRFFVKYKIKEPSSRKDGRENIKKYNYKYQHGNVAKKDWK